MVDVITHIIAGIILFVPMILIVLWILAMVYEGIRALIIGLRIRNIVENTNLTAADQKYLIVNVLTAKGVIREHNI